MPITKKFRYRLVLALLLAAMSSPAITSDTVKQASASTQAETEPDESARNPPGTDDNAPQNQPGETPPPESDAAVEPLRNFEPTDKIQADSAVSFPIDI